MYVEAQRSNSHKVCKIREMLSKINRKIAMLKFFLHTAAYAQSEFKLLSYIALAKK